MELRMRRLRYGTAEPLRTQPHALDKVQRQLSESSGWGWGQSRAYSEQLALGCRDRHGGSVPVLWLWWEGRLPMVRLEQLKLTENQHLYGPRDQRIDRAESENQFSQGRQLGKGATDVCKL